MDAGELAGARVLARFDFNVPLAQGGGIADTTRLDASLPTIRHLLNQGVSRLVLMGHLGRPKGVTVGELSLEPVGEYLSAQLGEEVILSRDCMGQGVRQLLNLSKTKIVLLENLRFYSGETQNQKEFAQALSRYGEFYVNDAFGACHRKHASTYGINAFYKNRNFGGLLLQREVAALSRVVGRPPGPFVAVLGGAKVGDKISVITALLPRVEKILLGGQWPIPCSRPRGLKWEKAFAPQRKWYWPGPFWIAMGTGRSSFP